MTATSGPAMARLAAPTAFELGRPERYAGTVHVARILRAADDTVRAYEVCFAAGGRTVWHAHAGEQFLVGLGGSCVVQCMDAPPRHLGPGDSFRVPAGLRHWHGALPGGPAAHLALNSHGPTEWGHPVSEAEFSAAVGVLD